MKRTPGRVLRVAVFSGVRCGRLWLDWDIPVRVHPVAARLVGMEWAQFVVIGQAFMQNLRRGAYELGLDTRSGLRFAGAFSDLALTL